MATAPLSSWHVTLTITPLAESGKLDPEDQSDPLFRYGGQLVMIVAAPGEDHAANLAEDRFHEEIPIAMLEDYDIEARAVPLGAHERIRLARHCDAPGILHQDAPRINARNPNDPA